MAYESGLPMELGLAAGKLCHGLEEKPLETIPGLSLPLAKELGKTILETADPLRFESDKLRDGWGIGKWKKAYYLSQTELRREAALIDQYLDRNQFALALGLMREWTVSLGALYRNKSTCWLDREGRLAIERELGAMSEESLQRYLDDEQIKWGRFWKQLKNQRNQLAHCGMKRKEIEINLGEINAFWQKIKFGDQVWASFGGGKGCLLLTSLGMSPGVLYSAIKKIQPKSVLILCSERARPGIAEAVNFSGFDGHYKSIIMQDPFNGYAEINNLLKESRETCLDADKVLVNLTGGTAMMGIVMQRLYEQARKDQRPGQRFVLTDKRPPEDQKSNPWVEAEIFWLDKTTDQGDDDG